MYTTMNDMLRKAIKEGKGVGAFNIHALEVVPVMVQAAAELESPIILQVSVSTAKYIGFDLLSTLVKKMADEKEIDIALHLDHAKELQDIEMALKGGFSSVMIDGSYMELSENIKITCAAAEMARKAGASIEAELGIVGRGERITPFPYTDPNEAAYFVEQTGIDALAVGIGTHHGQYKAKTEISLEVLKQIHDKVKVPLVLHGGTGVKEENLRPCIKLGMHKLNFGTELNVSWVRKAKAVFGDAKPDDSLRNLMILCNDAMKETVQNKIRLVRM